MLRVLLSPTVVAVAVFDLVFVVAKNREPIAHEVKVRVTVGARGLGLILAEEKEGSRWVVKGFRPMPGGKPNPGQVLFSSTIRYMHRASSSRRVYDWTLCMTLCRPSL